jgi:DNA polymerase III subunit delta'
MRFSDIPGHETTKSRLVQSVKNHHVAHALMFYGSEGSATLSLALAFAAFVNCEAKTDNDSCGKCASCYKIDKLTHPDFFYLFASSLTNPVEILTAPWRQMILENPYANITDWLDASAQKQANIPVEEARKLKKSLVYKPYEASFKIVLLWLPEHLNTAAANALLKSIEEPPNQTLFFLITHQYEAVLKTIQSRTQLINVPRYSNSEIKDILVQKLGISVPQAQQIALMASGSVSAAIKLLQNEVPLYSNWFAEWMRALFRGKFNDILAMADQYDAMAKETQKLYLIASIDMFRDLFLYKGQVNQLIYRSEEDQAFIEKFSQHLNFQHLEKLIHLLDQATFQIERNAKAKILFASLSFKLFKLVK